MFRPDVTYMVFHQCKIAFAVGRFLAFCPVYAVELLALLNMKNEFLSICIPSRNRAPLLRHLLKSLHQQIAVTPSLEEDVAVYVSDNASEDATPAVCDAYGKIITRFFHTRNATNIGGDANIMYVRTLAKGEYVWVLGDDELICKDSIARLLNLLRTRKPGLVIGFNRYYEYHKAHPGEYPDYRAFARDCATYNPHLLTEHTLISSNIYRRDLFDFDYARDTLTTCFSQLYGMIRPLQQNRAPVIIPDFPIIAIRKQPSSPVDGAWIELSDRWRNYMDWLRTELSLPDLDVNAPNRIARHMMKMRILRNPLGYAWIHRREWFRLSAWKFALRRLFS